MKNECLTADVKRALLYVWGLAVGATADVESTVEIGPCPKCKSVLTGRFFDGSTCHLCCINCGHEVAETSAFPRLWNKKAKR